MADTLMSSGLKKFSPEQGLEKRKILATTEKGKTYRIVMSPARHCAVYSVDGYIIKEGDKCDKLVLVENDDANHWTEVFVELKGKNISHAICQLRETIKNPLFCHQSITTKWARIVGQSFPRSTGNSIVEKARDEFKEKYGVQLDGWSSRKEDRI